MTPYQEVPPQKAANIKVYVRVRPHNKDEMAAGGKAAVTVIEDGRTVQVVEQGFGYNIMTRTFQFDGCLGPTAQQDEVMERLTVHKLLDSVLEGFSATLMACGQTGSGKTYTMSGRDEGVHVRNDLGKIEARRDDGLIARSVTYLFNSMHKRKRESGDYRLYTMRASYFEIYNEQIGCSTKEVRWSSAEGFYVENLLLVDCETLDDVFAVLDEGSRNRKVGSHEMNKDSSRSHCIMTLYVDSNYYVDVGQPITRYGRMLFVDLAGSERLKKSKSSGDMLRETGSINRSLFTLGKVISALSEGKRGDGVVPYRESMLTKLLMESLGGNSLALMIACVSPSTTALDETLSTLHYGTCAKNIVNAPSVNIDSRNKVVLELQMEIKCLREENSLLRFKLGLSSDEEVAHSSSCGPSRMQAQTTSKTHKGNSDTPKCDVSANSDPASGQQSKVFERLFAKDGKTHQESVESASLSRSENLVMEEFDQFPAHSFYLGDRIWALSDAAWPEHGSESVKHEDLWSSSACNSITGDALLGMHSGFGGEKCKGQK